MFCQAEPMCGDTKFKITRWDAWLAGAAFAAMLVAGLLFDVLSRAQAEPILLVYVGAPLAPLALLLFFNHRSRWRFYRSLRAAFDRIGVGEPKRLQKPWVLDGDTIEDCASGVRYRMANIDAPETGDNAKCETERRVGERAKWAAVNLFRSAKVVSVRATWRKDIYGRRIAYVFVDDNDLGETLVQMGLAVRWQGQRKAWCGRNGPLATLAFLRGESFTCTACRNWRN